MNKIDRLPAIPLITSDPYLSVWIPGDTVDSACAMHWSGAEKPVDGFLSADGERVQFLGKNEARSRIAAQTITATRTAFTAVCGDISLSVTFAAPAFPDDPDVMSMPVTLVRLRAEATDGTAHNVSLRLSLSDRLCYDGNVRPDMFSDRFLMNGWETAICGQKQQKPLSHSGDHITIDWGYLYLSADQGEVKAAGNGLEFLWQGSIESFREFHLIIAYDDIASINYFGTLCNAWYRRNGAQITDAIRFAQESFASVLERCELWDARIYEDSVDAAGEAYAKVTAAAWRQTMAAHKLIAAPGNKMVLLSKENDSNGCLGTADVSYPSIPMFLLYNPELVNALCRPILAFAEMPVWGFDFAPHDVGRYPYATGQVYAAKGAPCGAVHPPYYLYPSGCNIYDLRYQMPIEECGNMLIMLAAAQKYGADPGLAREHRETIGKWAGYLAACGADPGEQLCTDDFAGHLAHNVNLAVKAIVGVACCGILTGESAWMKQAENMAGQLLEKIGEEGNTPLTLDGNGWSLKYNLLWDRILGLGLFPDGFYRAELESYLSRTNEYGIPLDSRAVYSKSDWICWIAAMTDDKRQRNAFLAPLTRYLQETSARVPFSDWYDTETGCYVHFIARSVQGGVFAPILAQRPTAESVRSD